MSPAGRADTKVGVSDPVVERGIAIAQRIIGTLGITGLSGSRVHIDSPVWHLKIMGWSGSNFGHALANNGGALTCKCTQVIPWEVRQDNPKRSRVFSLKITG